MRVDEWLASVGRSFPAPDCPDGSTSMAAYSAADLPMIVACTSCQMTMVLTPCRYINFLGEIFCDECWNGGHHEVE